MLRVAAPLLLSLSGLHSVSLAGPKLLATYDTYQSGGGAPESTPQIEFILQLPAAEIPMPQLGLGAHSNSFWNDGEMGVSYITQESDPYFDTFASFATDGMENQFVLWTLFPSGTGSGLLESESALFGATPDLVGNTLEYVKMTVFDVRFQPWLPDPDNHPDIGGFRYLTFVRFEFYGTPVPEPSTLFLFTVVGLFARRIR